MCFIFKVPWKHLLSEHLEDWMSYHSKCLPLLHKIILNDSSTTLPHARLLGGWFFFNFNLISYLPKGFQRILDILGCRFEHVIAKIIHFCMTQKLNLIILPLEFFNTLYLIALISESLMQHKRIFSSSIPLRLVYRVLPSLWQICIFTGGLVVPSQSRYENSMPFQLLELVTFMVSYRSQALPVWVLKGSFKQGKRAQLIDSVVKRSVPRHTLWYLWLQWKPLVTIKSAPCHHLWLPHVRDYHLPAPEAEW